jgi:cytochrome c peroxidase
MQVVLKKPRKNISRLRNTGLLAFALLLFILNVKPIRADKGGSTSGSGGSGSSGDSGSGGGGGNPGPLSSVIIPAPPGLGTYVKDSNTLVVLGKGLFWDMQVGNDGKQACASCHFHAGADHRRTNQINPGTGGPLPVNYTLQAPDFPFAHGEIAGSAGVFRRTFNNIVPGNAVDDSTSVLDQTYSINSISVRRVTGRNAPTVINAVFNVRNFWDGRAKNIFTVFTPFGDSDPNTNIVLESGGALQPVRIRLDNSSLASQSVGPANNPVEMSSDGRNWQLLGKKMLSLPPLAKQVVDPSDSVLGSFAKQGGPGLKSGVTYASLIQTAFQPQYWNSSKTITLNGTQFTQMEYNFAMFWGLAVQAYEATLVSGNTPYDQFAKGTKTALTSIQAQGLNIFTGKGQCTKCHTGPEFTAAAFTTVNQTGALTSLSHGLKTDTGYFHTGVRPISDDPGIAGNDGFNVPLSIAMQQSPLTAGVGGAFKTPTIRNTEFTGPYFHNGSTSTLEQVVDFYNRGGDTPNDPNLGPGMQPLGLSASEKTALVEFMKALSDDRVRFEKAPFDHPQLCVPNGEKTPLSGNSSNEAADNMVEIPATGAGGNSAPLQTFAELVGATTANGARAHDLTKSCPIQ